LATENFNESLVVGRGGFGKVYEGTIFNGSRSINVAIKRLDCTSHQGPTEFWAEVDMLTKLRHCNLVLLSCYYATGKSDKEVVVYAFGGSVFVEMLCRKRAVDKRSQIYPKCLKEFVRIAERCLHNNPQKRSTMAEVVVSLESVLALQEKINSSLQASGKTIFGRIVDRLYFPYNGEHTAHGDSKVASDMKDNDRRTNNSIVPDNTQESLFGKGNFGEVFLAWVDKNTFTPSRRGDGIAVAIRRCCSSSNPGHDKLLVCTCYKCKS
ncbi:concanavalin A-like lectin/glucanase, partial [Tanacetum coccineum]